MEDIVPDFLGIAIDKIPFDDLISLSETNKTWNTWMRNNLNNVAGNTISLMQNLSMNLSRIHGR